MYVCLCKGITEKHVKKILDSGVMDVKSIQKQSDAGTDCGSCVSHIAKMIKESQDTPFSNPMDKQ